MQLRELSSLFRKGKSKNRYCVLLTGLPRQVTRPSVARTVLKSALSLTHLLIHSFFKSSFSSQSSRHHKSQTIRARERKAYKKKSPMSGVRCQVSGVRYHVSHFFLLIIIFFFFSPFFGQSGEGIWWRVCYHWGLPCLVYVNIKVYCEKIFNLANLQIC